MSDEGQREPSRREAFTTQTQLLSGDDVSRVLRRMAHEVLERHGDLGPLVIIGLQSGGVPFARRLRDVLAEIAGDAVDYGTLEVAFFRDDLDRRPVHDASVTAIPVDLADRVVVLVDDVLYTGRTIRAALSALSEWGRPRSVELAVIVDRGHRQLPIRPDYVGKNLPTSLREAVVATLDGVWIGTQESS